MSALLSVLLVAGCGDEGHQGPTGLDPQLGSTPALWQAGIDPLSVFADRITGFGGAAFDDQGEFEISLTPEAMKSVAIRSAAVDAFLQEHGTEFFRDREGAPIPFRFREVEFSYRQLAGWRTQALALLDLPHAHSLDLDEVRNLISIKVAEEAAIQDVEAAALELGIPPEALSVVVRPPAEFYATLYSKVRPFPGGVQVKHQSKAECTAGFIAVRSGTVGFVTNSHCSPTFGSVDSGWFGQATSDGSDWVGPETVDPPFSTLPNCPQGQSCSFADASFVAQIFAGSSVSLGKIAKTAGRCTTNCQSYRTIYGSFDVLGEATVSYSGQELQKVGRTTGWTYGNVTETCVVEAVPGLSNKSLVCQYWFGAGAQSGDSGSPVFAWNGSNGATIHGVMWGGTGTATVFSPMSGIESDLGALTTK